MKAIQLTQTQVKEILKQIEQNLQQTKTNSSTLNISYDLSQYKPKNIKKPTMIFSNIAFQKMQQLVNTCNDEIAWYCTVSKNNQTYKINDVFVYPQTVTATTVQTDDKLIAQWVNSLDDKIFNSLRLQGHSHVNMAVSPSGVDSAYYDQMLQSCKKNDDYYIFLIMNKKGEFWVNIYDFAQNTIFETNDIIIRIEGVTNYSKWVEDSLQNLSKPKYRMSKYDKDTYWEERYGLN